MNLVIDRAIWDRGSAQGAHLLTVDNGERKQCCVGIYLTACGLSDAALDWNGSVSDLDDLDIDSVPGWLWREVDAEDEDSGSNYVRREDTNLASSLYAINDDSGLPEIERERQVAEKFAQNGINVTFVGSQP